MQKQFNNQLPFVSVCKSIDTQWIENFLEHKILNKLLNWIGCIWKKQIINRKKIIIQSINQSIDKNQLTCSEMLKLLIHQLKLILVRLMLLLLSLMLLDDHLTQTRVLLLQLKDEKGRVI